LPAKLDEAASAAAANFSNHRKVSKADCSPARNYANSATKEVYF
jgi:hypothetical protein